MSKRSEWYYEGFREGFYAAQVNLTEKDSRLDLERYAAQDRLGEYAGEIREHQVQMAGDISYEVDREGGPTEAQYEAWEQGFYDGFEKTVRKELKIRRKRVRA